MDRVLLNIHDFRRPQAGFNHDVKHEPRILVQPVERTRRKQAVPDELGLIGVAWPLRFAAQAQALEDVGEIQLPPDADILEHAAELADVLFAVLALVSPAVTRLRHESA